VGHFETMKYLIIAATAGKMSAEKIALSGGSSIIDPTLITALFAGLALVIGSITTLLYKNFRENRERDRFAAGFVSQCECEQHRIALGKRIDELGPALNRIFNQLRENDKKSEERSMQLHRRIDPVLEKTAANAAELQVIKTIIGKEKVK